MEKTCRSCRFNYFGSCTKMKEVISVVKLNPDNRIVNKELEESSKLDDKETTFKIEDLNFSCSNYQ